jgi:hypothetical protein
MRDLKNRARFTGQVASPVAPAQAVDAFTANTASSMKGYFETVSRGRQTTTTDVFGAWSLGVSSCAVAISVRRLRLRPPWPA